MTAKEVKDTIKENMQEFVQEELEEAILIIEQNRYKGIEQVVEELKEMLEVTKSQLLDRIDLLYTKFSDNHNFFNLSNAFLSKKELKSLERDIKRYLDSFEEQGIEIDYDYNVLLNGAGNRATILDYFQLIAIAEMEQLYYEVTERLGIFFEDSTRESINREAFEIFSALGVGIVLEWDKLNLDDITSRTWRSTGADWKETLWYNKRLNLENMKKSVLANAPLENGKELTKDRVGKVLDSDEAKFKRTVVSDTTNYGLEGHRDLMEYLDIEKSIFTAVLDSRTSEICRDMDGTIINNDDIRVGENAPPLHENCRSVLSPYIDVEWSLDFGTRAARDVKSGKTYFVPAGMTYREWEKTTQTEEE